MYMYMLYVYNWPELNLEVGLKNFHVRQIHPPPTCFPLGASAEIYDPKVQSRNQSYLHNTMFMLIEHKQKKLIQF